MANGRQILNLSAHAQYQYELMRLLAGMEGQPEKATADAALAFRWRWGLPCPEADPAIYLVGLHRQRFRSRLVKPELCGYSAKWLIERGFSLDRDTVFATAPVAKKDKVKKEEVR